MEGFLWFIVAYVIPFLALVYLAWRVTWKPQRSSKPGWVLIVTGGVLWPLLFGSALGCDSSYFEGITTIHVAYGEVFAGVLALELWSRLVLHQRLEGRSGLEAKLVWRILLALILLTVWIPIGDRIWFVVDRYHGTGYVGYGSEVCSAIWRGVLWSVFAYGAVGVVRNVVELLRAGMRQPPT